MKKNILDALVVYYNEHEQVYEIVKGQRRFLAAKELREEGFPIKELPCIVKEAEAPLEATEESLMDELMKQAVEPSDIGKAILSLTKKYGTVEAAAQALGIDFQFLDYYVSRLPYNPPAKVEEVEEKKEEKKTPIVTLETYTRPTSPTDPIATLTFTERKELERRLQEDPKKPLALAISEVKMWTETTREASFSIEEKNYKALVDWAKEPHKEHTVTVTIKTPEIKNPIVVRRAMDILLNEFLKEYLKQEKYL